MGDLIERLRDAAADAAADGYGVSGLLAEAAADLEAAREEVAGWKRVAAAQAELHGEAQAHAERLEGWTFARQSDGSIVVTGETYGSAVVRADDLPLANALLYMLACDLLAAAPSAQGVG